MPLFTTNATPNTVETLCEANAERKQVVVHNGMAGAVVRVDKDAALVATSGNVAYYQDHLIFRGPIAAGRLSIVSDTASSTVYYTEVV